MSKTATIKVTNPKTGKVESIRYSYTSKTDKIKNRSAAFQQWLTIKRG